MALNTIIFDILAKDRASRTLTKVGNAAEKTGKKFSALKGAVTGVTGLAVVKFGKDSVKAFTDAEQATTQLQDAFARFPKLADSNIKAFQALNQELQKKTKFDDEAYASGQAILAQFGLTGKEILKVTPLLGDYAAKTGKDVPTAAKLLGKASLGNARALKDLGINFKATGDQSKDMATVIGLVSEKVGGFAEKQGKSAAGQAAILGNQFEELQETVGSKLVPALLKLAEVGLQVVAFVQKNAAVVLPLAGAIATVVVALKAWRIAQAALNIVLATNPIVLIVAALAALAVGLVIAYKKSETFRNIVKTAFKVVANAALTTVKIGLLAFKAYANAWLTAAGLIVKGAAFAFGWVPGLGGKLRKANKVFESFRAGVNNQFDKVIDKVDQMQRKINNTHGKTVKVTVEMQMKNRLKIAAQQGVSLTISGKPIAMAAGGPIRGPGTGTSDSVPMMGSTGEYVIKASRARQLGTKFLDMLNGAKSIGGDAAGMVLKFARGGLIGAAQNFVRAQASDPYIWGGVGPNGFDCSGLTGAVYGILRGLNPYQRYFTTASNFAALGFKPGTGAYTIGVNPYTHMAGNIGGLPFEAANTRSGIHVGAGAQSVLNFARKYYLASLGGVFGGNGSVALGPNDLRKIMRAISIDWGVPSAGQSMTADRGGWLRPGRTMVDNWTGRSERILGPNEKIALDDRTIDKLGRAFAAAVGAAGSASARRADLYARAY